MSTTTTTISFAPNGQSIPQFSAVLDGTTYNCTCTWNLFGCRYYLNIYTQSNELIVSRPLVGSPLGYDLTSVTSANNIAVATTSTEHTYTVGSVVQLTIAGVTPSDYNGVYNCNIISNTQFTYSVASGLSDATAVGTATWNLSLTEGYFTDMLTYFPDSQYFLLTNYSSD